MHLTANKRICALLGLLMTGAALAAMLAGPVLLRLRLNLDMLAYSRQLKASEAAGALAYPHLSLQDGPHLTIPIAARPPATSTAVDWTMLRLALSRADFTTAKAIADRLPEEYLSGHDLPRYDALLASALAVPQAAARQLANQQNGAEQIPKVVRDSIVSGMYRYQDLSSADLAPTTDGRKFLETVRLLRPDDLYAALQLWRANQDAPGEPRSSLKDRLTEFTRDAVLPADKRLYPSIYAAIPWLYEAGLWSKRQVAVIGGRLLEDCVQPEAAGQMLETLGGLEAQSQEWSILKRQLDSCRGAPQKPRARRVETFSDAERNDLDRQVMSEVFEAPGAVLGENLILNGDFATLSVPSMSPEWWRWACPQFPRGDEGLFFSDRPEGSPTRGIAILGFWRDVERPGVCGFYNASQYAEQLRPIALEPNGVYLLTLEYRTEWLNDNEAGIYIDSEPGGFYQGGLPLAQTEGCWRRVYLLGRNPNPSPKQVEIFLYSGGQNGGVGRVEFDDVRLSSVPTPPTVAENKPYLIHSIAKCETQDG